MQEITELQQINKEASKFYNYEQAVKLMLNSIYGAFGNPYFYFFNVDIAETITLQGKDAILYTEELLNRTRIPKTIARMISTLTPVLIPLRGA